MIQISGKVIFFFLGTCGRVLPSLERCFFQLSKLTFGQQMTPNLGEVLCRKHHFGCVCFSIANWDIMTLSGPNISSLNRSFTTTWRMFRMHFVWSLGVVHVMIRYATVNQRSPNNPTAELFRGSRIWGRRKRSTNSKVDGENWILIVGGVSICVRSNPFLVLSFNKVAF